MKLIWYECKKIWNIQTVVFLVAFTFLFYLLFIRSTIHPEDSADCVAADDLRDILQKEYGYDAILPYENFGILEEIRLKQIEQLDKLVVENEVFQAEGISSWEQLRKYDYEELSEEAQNARSEISFGTGERQVFLVQAIENYYSMMKYNPIMGIEDGKEWEAAKTFQSHMGNRNTRKSAINVVAKYMERDWLSLLPHGVTDHVSWDFPKIGILMIICCMVLVLPYQIRERLSGVVALQKTTRKGRSFWKSQLRAVLLSCTLVCLMQLFAFGLVLYNSGILRYFHFPINGNTFCYYWLDVRFGTYLLITGTFYTLLALGSSIIFFLISRISSNYIVGIGMGIPTTFLLGTGTYFCMKFFLQIRNGYRDFVPYLGWLSLLLAISLFICLMINRREQRSDILL